MGREKTQDSAKVVCSNVRLLELESRGMRNGELETLRIQRGKKWGEGYTCCEGFHCIASEDTLEGDVKCR